jgi:hypothetical protein
MFLAFCMRILPQAERVVGKSVIFFIIVKDTAFNYYNQKTERVLFWGESIKESNAAWRVAAEKPPVHFQPRKPNPQD